MCCPPMSTAQLSSGSPVLGTQQACSADLEVILQQEWQSPLATCDPFLVEPKPAMLAPDLGCRLLVTWAPASAALQANDLQALFQQFGAIQELEVSQDQETGQSLGTAHLIYASSQAASAAVSGHSLPAAKQHWPHQLQDIKVQFVQQSPMFQGYHVGSSSSTQPDYQKTERLPGHITTSGLADVSSSIPGSYGAVPAAPYPGQSSQQAIPGQHHQQLPQQLQHVVSDASSSSLSSAVPPQQEADLPKTSHHTLFFAKVPRSASRCAVFELFSAFGEVVDLNLFAESPDAPLSKGCGLVMFADLDVALAALQQLEGKYTWAGMRSPMVLKLMNPEAKQKHQQRPEQRRPGQSAAAGSSSGRMSSQWALGQQQQPIAAAIGQPPNVLLHPPGGQAQQQLQPEQVPAGCSRDSFKLFIGNIPKSYSAAALRPVFDSIGPVAELVVIRDKATSDSKGCAFVWYATGAHAEQAIQQLNMRVVLPGYGPQESAHNRPLVVKRATQQWRPQFPFPIGAGAAGSPALPMQAAPMFPSAVAAGGAAGPVLHPQLLQQQPALALLEPTQAQALLPAETGQATGGMPGQAVSGMPGQQIVYVPQATSQAIRRPSGGAAAVRPASVSPRPPLSAVLPAGQAAPPMLLPAQQLPPQQQQMMMLPQQYVTYSAGMAPPQGQLPAASTTDVLERFALLQLQQQQQQVLGGPPLQGVQSHVQLQPQEAAALGYSLPPTAAAAAFAVPQNPQSAVGAYQAAGGPSGNPGALQVYPQAGHILPGQAVQGYPQPGQVLSGTMQGYPQAGQVYSGTAQGYPQAGQAFAGTMQVPSQAGPVLPGSMQGYLQAVQAMPAGMQGYPQAGQVSGNWPGYPIHGQVMPVGFQDFDAAQVQANPQSGVLPNPVGVPTSSGASYIVPGMQYFPA